MYNSSSPASLHYDRIKTTVYRYIKYRCTENRLLTIFLCHSLAPESGYQLKNFQWYLILEYIKSGQQGLKESSLRHTCFGFLYLHVIWPRDISIPFVISEFRFRYSMTCPPRYTVQLDNRKFIFFIRCAL